MRGIWVVCDLNYFTAIGHFFFPSPCKYFDFMGKTANYANPNRVIQSGLLSFRTTNFISNSYEAFFFFVLPKQFFFSI